MGWAMRAARGVGDDDKLDATAARRVLVRSARMLGPYRSRAIAAAILLISWTLLTLAGPLLVRRAIDRGLEPRDPGQLNLAIVLYVAVAIASYVTYRFAIASLARVGEGFLRGLRVRVFDRILDQSMPFYDREKSGVLISRMTADIDSLQDLVQQGLLQFSSAALLVVLSGITLAIMSWQLLLLCLVVAPVIFLASRKFQRDSNVAYLAVRDNVGTTLTSLQEGISGVRIVQAFAREEVEADRFAQTNDRLYRTHMDSVRVAAWYLPIIEFSAAITTALTLGVGGWMVREGRISLGTVVAFVLILQSLFTPVQQLSQLFNLVQSATAALSKLFGLLDEPIEVADPPHPVPLPGQGAVSIEGVQFSYPDGTPVLHDLFLDIPAGERIALVGPTGAGKSTVAKLVARFYDPTSGRITVDGIDLRDTGHDSLRTEVVVIPQEGYLFDGTIADNIRVARPDASDQEIAEAIERIGVKPVFDQLPDGLATEVQERGSRLSAGERQLVSLARAALVDPSILILDEATSSVDPGTEALVEAAMETLMESRTVIVIAHRLSTSARCDRVGVIVDGRLVELGTHDHLVAAGGHYSDLFDAWTRS